MKKILVAYFSATGSTATVAKHLAKVLHGDLFEIAPKVPYTPADLNWTDRNSRSSVEMRDPDCRPAMLSPVPKTQSYDVIFLGFPIWWYREPSIIDTFIENCDLTGKTIVPFVTSGGSELGPSGENIQKFAPQAIIQKGRRFETNVSEAALFEWASPFL